MSDTPLRILVLARDDSAKIAAVRAKVEALVASNPETEAVWSGVMEDLEPGDVEADLAITLGGDGAILRAGCMMGRRQIPLLGINLGRLGFLADLTQSEFEACFERIASREFNVVEHLMFECDIRHADGKSETHLGLNEVVVASAASLTMLDVQLAIDGRDVTTYSGDGLIISTPIGSTAHSLSAGGPILRQDMQAFVVTPICPHTLTVRPLVDRADSEYTMTFPRLPEGAMLVIDGQIRRALSPADTIVVRKADVSFRLAKVPGHSYYTTLYRKLGWGGQPRYRRT